MLHHVDTQHTRWRNEYVQDAVCGLTLSQMHHAAYRGRKESGKNDERELCQQNRNQYSDVLQHTAFNNETP